MKVFVHTRTIFKAEPLPANQLPVSYTHLRAHET